MTESDPAIATMAALRGIHEVLHFTTNRGLLGIFATGGVSARDLLYTDDYIEHIYTPNCAERLKDADWTGYVNLSIGRVNTQLFKKSERWHTIDDVYWVVLAFDAELLAHRNVYFATTNNIYPCVKRDTGASGLAALYDRVIEWGYYKTKIERKPTMPTSFPTDPQAEVLYPKQVPLDYLRRIYVREPEHIDWVNSLFPLLQVSRVPVEHKPEVFQ
ncbi:DUF4433 domain-containing protein [Saccharopolyspora sp. HNM0986]|uniref:DarT ssDNA thymidine ADP-ribosyltransferase family protein n=1 Tax=Saccharopolyspora galaxeae TaxID=2781241 RepID=UPI00190B04F4|nr:DarT ssDNA thymidine ADP-ribosyltransferase family protein [Saccharopolyspora sp. HNM0986]MBK0868313.1 DUF4433 domain-containing protein [Saccharopolyspora sp. HNM0986]